MPSSPARQALLLLACLTTSCLCAFAAPHTIQDAADAFSQQFATLSAANSLDAAGLPPWHMHVSYTRSDAASPITGSLELWSSGKNQTRVELVEPERKDVYLLSATGRLRGKDSKPLPQGLVFLVRDLIHPFPAAQNFEVEKTEEADFGSVHTKCLLERPQSVTRNPDDSLGKIPTFCVDPANALRAAWFQSGIKVLNNATGTFQDHNYPQTASISFRDRQMVDAKVDSFEPWKGAVDLAADNFVPDVFTGPVRVSAGVLQAMRLKNVTPHYPQTAKQDRITGTVILAIKIGTDGSIQDLSVVSAPRDDLAAAATEAVRQWTYKPYLLNGAPVQVNSTVAVNFNLAP